MERVKFEVEFVTPCFLGGADNKANAEWRGASIRGQLRWWFRALQAGIADEKTLREEEVKYLGSTDIDSPRTIRCSPLPGDAIGTPKSRSFEKFKEGGGKDSINGVAYLGYGPIENLGTGEVNLKSGKERKAFQNQRPFIKEGTKTTFSLTCKGCTFSETDRQVLSLWDLFGGIGARSRRGFGSIGLCSPDHRLFDLHELLGSMKVGGDSFTWGNPLPINPGADLPMWSRFSKYSRIFEWRKGFDDCEKALHDVGKSLIEFRRRYNHCVEDYEWAYNPHNEKGLPSRIGFGLPLPFGKVVLEGTVHDRRASPLLIKIFKTDKDKFVPRLLYLPSIFLDQNEQVQYSGKAGHGTSYPVTNSHYEIVPSYLATLKSLAEEIKP
jgi:CRISPR-associated protein Cmr1